MSACVVAVLFRAILFCISFVIASEARNPLLISHEECKARHYKILITRYVGFFHYATLRSE